MAVLKQAAATETAAEIAEGEAIGIVARGRTVVDHDGRKGPGEEVILPLAEIRELIRAGFLEDPDAEPVKEANGPSFERR